MAITVTQTCEMCGRERTLQTQDDEESGYWRKLISHAKTATLCNGCVDLVVDHARLRARQRDGNRPGELNGTPLRLEFWEAQ